MNTGSNNQLHQQPRSEIEMNTGTGNDHKRYQFVLADHTRMKREISAECHKQEAIRISAAALKTVMKNKGPISNCNMRRNVPRTTAVQDRDYLERRRINNAASKRSRDKANMRSADNAEKVLELEKKNKILKQQLELYGAMLTDLNDQVKKEFY